MRPITGFRAFWHPGQNTFGIEVSMQGGPLTRIACDSPQEFMAILAILNGPNPAFTPQGHIVGGR